MPEFMSATAVQKSVLAELRVKHSGATAWVKYEPEVTRGNLQVMFFLPKYIFEYKITPDGYIKGETAYDNPQHIQPSQR